MQVGLPVAAPPPLGVARQLHLPQAEAQRPWRLTVAPLQDRQGAARPAPAQQPRAVPRQVAGQAPPLGGVLPGALRQAGAPLLPWRAAVAAGAAPSNRLRAAAPLRVGQAAQRLVAALLPVAVGLLAVLPPWWVSCGRSRRRSTAARRVPAAAPRPPTRRCRRSYWPRRSWQTAAEELEATCEASAPSCRRACRLCRLQACAGRGCRPAKVIRRGRGCGLQPERFDSTGGKGKACAACSCLAGSRSMA